MSRRSRPSRPPVGRSSCPRATSAAGGRSTTTASSSSPSAICGATSSSWGEWYRAGVPIVGLEPSCVAVFKDELGKLIPNDDDAKQLAASVYHFAEFFQEFAIEPPPLARKAFVWGHCHHRATDGLDPEVQLLQKMGVDVETLKAGCCGLAGSWGFEADHYKLSMEIGELGLLPRIRDLPDDALVVADGFSCKTQIAHGTGRRAIHVAEVLQLAGVATLPRPEAP